jgi:hypothetical protein
MKLHGLSRNSLCTFIFLVVGGISAASLARSNGDTGHVQGSATLSGGRHLRIVDDEPAAQNRPAMASMSGRRICAEQVVPSTPPALADAFAPFAGSLKLRWDEQFLYVGSNGMPNHQMMVGITNWQQQVPLPQSYFGNNAWQIPLHPVPAEKPITIKGHFLRGAIALAVNGVPIFNPQNNRGEISQDIGELDAFGGHCGRGDDYHYHVAPLFLEKTVGPGKPIAMALDGYPIYGSTGPDGKPVDEKTLDAYRGKAESAGGYAYYASTKYPFVLGAFHGQVIERGGQVDPQPRAQPVRPAGRPLSGAKITAFNSPKPNNFTLKYEYDEAVCTINYSIEADGTCPFEFIDGQGHKHVEVYHRRAEGGPPPGGPEQEGPPPR